MATTIEERIKELKAEARANNFDNVGELYELMNKARLNQQMQGGQDLQGVMDWGTGERRARGAANVGAQRRVAGAAMGPGAARRNERFVRKQQRQDNFDDSVARGIVGNWSGNPRTTPAGSTFERAGTTSGKAGAAVKDSQADRLEHLAAKKEANGEYERADELRAKAKRLRESAERFLGRR